MSVIVITPPDNYPNEIEIINSMFNFGLECLHLRKPYFQCQDYVDYLQKIDKQYYNRIVIHQYFNLVKEFNLKGLHINRRESIVPCSYTGSISMSCHCFDEIIKNKDKCDYLFLSPIFNSISKLGYVSKFGELELREASSQGLIDNKLYALGGVCPSNFDFIKSLNFGGVALLGIIWNNNPLDNFTKCFNSWYYDR